MANGHRVKAAGGFKTDLKLKDGVTRETSFIVINISKPMILGSTWMNENGVKLNMKEMMFEIADTKGGMNEINLMTSEHNVMEGPIKIEMESKPSKN